MSGTARRFRRTAEPSDAVSFGIALRLAARHDRPDGARIASALTEQGIRLAAVDTHGLTHLAETTRNCE